MRGMRSGRGYSLLELALVVVVAGAAVTVGATVFQQRTESSRAVTHASLVNAADEALLGFVHGRHRLPCPASSEAGVEDCTTTVGFLPWRTLGMAVPPLNGAGHQLRYAHYSRSDANSARDASLANVRDRFRPYFAATAPAVASFQVMGNTNGLDFCQALVNASLGGASQSYLNVRNSETAQFVNVAYVLINPGQGDASGNGSVLDGLNASLSNANPVAERPGRPSDRNYDDRVHAVYFNQLSQALGCASVMTPGNSHASTLTAAAVMQQAMKDYRVQLDFKVFLAAADTVAAVTDVLGVVVDTAKTTSEASTAVAAAINSGGGLAGAIVMAAIAAGLVAITIVGTAGGTAAALAAAIIAGENLSDFGALQSDLDVIRASIHQNVISMDAAGLYE